MTKFARHVTILVRKDDFSCATSVADQAKNHEKITVLYNATGHGQAMDEASGFANPGAVFVIQNRISGNLP